MYRVRWQVDRKSASCAATRKATCDRLAKTISGTSISRLLCQPIWYLTTMLGARKKMLSIAMSTQATLLDR
jgi:hypothetical protein